VELVEKVGSWMDGGRVFVGSVYCFESCSSLTFVSFDSTVSIKHDSFSCRK